MTTIPVRMRHGLIPSLLLVLVSACGGNPASSLADASAGGAGLGGAAGASTGSGGAVVGQGGSLGAPDAGASDAAPADAGSGKPPAGFLAGWNQFLVPDPDHFVLGSGSRERFSVAKHEMNGTGVYESSTPYVLSSLGPGGGALYSGVVGRSDASMYLLGRTQAPIKGQTQSQPGQTDIYVAKLDARGGSLWARQTAFTITGKGNPLTFEALATDGAGNLYVYETYNFGGWVLRKLSGSDGAVVWTKNYDFVKMANDLLPGAKRVVSGTAATTTATGTSYLVVDVNAGAGHAWLALKVDPAGETVWTRTVDNSCLQNPTPTDPQGTAASAVRALPDDSAIFVAGTCLTRLDDKGAIVWTHPLGYSHADAYFVEQPRGIVPRLDFALAVADDGSAIYLAASRDQGMTTKHSLQRFDDKGQAVWSVPLEQPGVGLTLEPTNQVLLFSQAAPARLVQASAKDGMVVRTLK